MDWQLQEAKSRFSQLVQQARTQGPQTVTVRGERAVVVLSAADYDALRGDRPTIVDHILCGPPWSEEFSADVTARAKTPSRDVEF